MAQTNRDNCILEIKDLTVCYGAIVALQKINLDIQQGEIIILIGANGSGKSTLLKTIIGIEKPNEGHIVYQGNDITFWNPEHITQCGIFLIPEDGGVFKTLTVEENLQLGAYHFYSKYQKQLDFVINLFPLLKNRFKQIAGTLSGGEQRILAFGKTLMSDIRILMFDEPSMGLSPKYISQIFETIQVLKNYSYTILLSEQNVIQAYKYADRIYLLENGQIVLQGYASDLNNHPRIKEAYLGG